MPFYETVFIARQDLSEQQVKALTDKFSQFIKDGGGKIHKTEYWGLRALAYRIQKNRRGHYVLIESDCTPEALQEMERNLRIDEDVIRYMSVREETLSTGPSAILVKTSRDFESEDGPKTTEQEAA